MAVLLMMQQIVTACQGTNKPIVLRVQCTDRSIPNLDWRGHILVVHVLQNILDFRYVASVEKRATKERLRSKIEVIFFNFHPYKTLGRDTRNI